VIQIQQEKIKDVIIDYIFDFLYQDRVQFIKSDNINISVGPNYEINKDILLSTLIKSAIDSGSFNMYYGEREVNYCELVSAQGVHHEFLNRIERLGYLRTEITLEIITSLVQELCDKGYIVRNQPKSSELKLSKKGVNHYENGNSFEQKFIQYQEVKEANKLSKRAIWISGLTLLITLIMTLLKSIFGLIILQ
jgi:hypothetical protein